MIPLRQTRSKRRLGVTLSEVLVSLLVMSVGVVALATLFPIATLRMIQATQLTQSTQLRYNAEARTRAQPSLLNGSPEWKSGWNYIAGDLCIPSVKSTQYFVCTQGGMSGTREPIWKNQVGGSTNDGGVTWHTRNARVYIVDPLGWEERCNDMIGLSQIPTSMGADLRNTFGRGTLSAAWPPPWAGALTADSPYRIARFRGTAPDNLLRPLVESTANLQALRLRQARDAAVSPDSFKFQAESSDLDPTAFVTDGNGRLTGIAIRDLPSALTETITPLSPVVAAAGQQLVEGRITLFDVTGRFSEVRSIRSIDSTTLQQQIVNFGDPVADTPAPLDWNRAPFLNSLGAPVIGRVVIETREQRFSWILACRISGGSTYASVVCFFNRSSNGEDELIHPAHFSTRFNVDDSDPLDDILNNNRVVVQFNPTATETPFLKRGGYVCDAQNNRWYRITSYQEVADARAAQTALDFVFPAAQLGNGPGAVLTLEIPILENSGYYRGGNPAGPGGVILMPGIIDVYPLDPSLPWEEN